MCFWPMVYTACKVFTIQHQAFDNVHIGRQAFRSVLRIWARNGKPIKKGDEKLKSAG